MNRRSLLRSSGALIAGSAIGALSAGAVITATPAASNAEADPLLALIAEYREQLAIYNASGNQTSEEENALAAVTLDPPYHRLRDECPTPTTMEGAIEGVRLVTDELRDGGYGGIERGVLAAVVAFFDGRA